jgi:AraC-like DNA-binding protein
MEEPFKIFRQQAEELRLSPPLHAMRRAGNIPGVRDLVAKGAYGRMHLQEIKGAGYTIWHHSYFFNKEETITLVRSYPDLRLWIALKRSLYYSIDGRKEKVLHERGFNICYTPSLRQSICFSPQQPYTYAEICFSRAYLKQFACLVPGVEKFLQSMNKNEFAFLNETNSIADAELLNLINDVLFRPYPFAGREKFLTNKILEILILALSLISNNPAPSAALDRSLLPRFYHAVDLLTGNLARTYSIRELSILSGLSAHDLQHGFETIYCLSIQEFLYEARMQKARMLLEQTDFNIAQVARQIGYSHPFAFSSAYKKYFGHSPSLVQRSKRKLLTEDD